MSQQLELLTTMLNFYKKRYAGADLETKFNDACDDLINAKDITHAAYMEFCVNNDIEPKIKKKTKTYSSDPCGSGGYARSSC